MSYCILFMWIKMGVKMTEPLHFYRVSCSVMLRDTTPFRSNEQTPLSPPPVDLRQLSARQRVFHELVKTECNYVSILDAIEKVMCEISFHHTVSQKVSAYCQDVYAWKRITYTTSSSGGLKIQVQRITFHC